MSAPNPSSRRQLAAAELSRAAIGGTSSMHWPAASASRIARAITALACEGLAASLTASCSSVPMCSQMASGTSWHAATSSPEILPG